MASSNSSNPSPAPSAPTLTMADLAPVTIGPSSPTTDNDDDNAPPPSKDVLLCLPDAQLHLIDRHRSHPLAAGELSLLRIPSGDTSLSPIALLNSIQWPLARVFAAVKLDPCHYSFSLTVPASPDDPNPDPLHYGLTLSHPDLRLDGILATYTNFSVQSVVGGEALANRVGGEVEAAAAAYWTAVAPNVEEYGGAMARAIATGAGHLANGILRCGDVTVEGLRWGNEVLRKRIQPGNADAEVSPEMLRRIKRAQKATKMSEKVATGILSGVEKVTDYVARSVANSKAGKKVTGYFSKAGKKVTSLLPEEIGSSRQKEEIALAFVEGSGKIRDAADVAAKNVLSASSAVTTDLVSHKYGEKAAVATNEGLDAASHAIGAAWAVKDIMQALDPTELVKTTITKAAAAELRAKHSRFT